MNFVSFLDNLQVTYCHITSVIFIDIFANLFLTYFSIFVIVKRGGGGVQY